MSSTVQQFNIQYNREEDRLILKMLLSDNGEIRLWLTRRYTQMMLAAFGQVTEGVAEEAATQHHTQEVKAFQQ
ncbi:MAG: hypothetical protein HOA22_06640, partial [Gammaproteobacteria bacterium]|nr:hypothetical protein [Gammaproteobacteria bacterium]